MCFGATFLELSGQLTSMSDRDIRNPSADLTSSSSAFTIALYSAVHFKSVFSLNNAEMHIVFHAKFAI